MKHRPDLIVVGAGVTGLFTALSLSEAGLRPTVVPAPGVAELLPQLDSALLPSWRWPSVFRRLQSRALQILPTQINHLAQETGVDLALGKVSLLELGHANVADQPLLQPDTPSGHDRPPDLERGHVADFEPQLALGQRSAIRERDCPVLRVDRLTRALTVALRVRDVQIQTHSAVKRLDVAGNIVLGVELADGSTCRAEATIVAGDQASAALVYGSGLERYAGQSRLAPALQFAPSSAALECAIVEPSLLLMPRLDGRLVAISNIDANARVLTPPMQLRRLVHSLVPGLGRHDLERNGRLAVPNSQAHASIGAYPGVRGLWLNTGHDAFGPIIASAAAEFLSEQLSGGPAVRELAVTLSPSMQPSC